MNENKITNLLIEISNEMGSELKVSSDNAPLISSIVYEIANEVYNLQIKLTKAADISAFNKNITIDFRWEGTPFRDFKIGIGKHLFSLIIPQLVGQLWCKFRLIYAAFLNTSIGLS